MRAIAFDMDGVLVDSERYWVEREAREIFPRVVAGDVDPAEITGMNVVDLYHHLSAEYDTTVDEATFLDVYDGVAREIYDREVRLLPGFVELVDRLRERGTGVALVSSSPERWIDRVLDRFDLHDAFDAVVSADHVDRGKPDPAVYSHAAESLGVDPEASLAVEDSVHGVRAARRAGMTCLGYRTETNDEATLEEADAIVDGPGELRRVLLTRTSASPDR